MGANTYRSHSLSFPFQMPVEFALAGGAGAVFGTAILLLRLYLVRGGVAEG